MDHYRENLEHVVRPEDPSERRTADSISLHAYEALYLRRGLLSYAAYDAPSAEHEGVALAYAEYIDTAVRDNRVDHVSLYYHTDTAVVVLVDAVDAIIDHVDDLHADVESRVGDAV